MSDVSSRPDPADEQSTAESLDDEVIDPADYPPDRPLGVDDPAVTAVGEEGGESVRQRAGREEPEGADRPDEHVIGLIEADDADRLDGDISADVGDEPDDPSPEERAMHLEEG